MTPLSRRVGALIVMAACAIVPARAQGLAAVTGEAGPLTPAPSPTRIALTQHLDAALPLQAGFIDSTGRAVRLGDEFAGAGRDAPPVLLVLGYYRCAQLCGPLMQGLLEALHAGGVPAASYRIVFASIAPAETPADAAIRRRVTLGYARFLDGADDGTPAPTLDLLVGPPASIAALTRSVGYAYQVAAPAARPMPSDSPVAPFDHPAGVVVCTPAGRVSSYLMGVRFDPQELRAALGAAAGGRAGSLTDRIALLCRHFDPRQGRWSGAVLAGVRVLGLATLALIGLFAWRRRPPACGGGA